MESQLKTLESKFAQREQELRVAVDDIRSSSKLERSRLRAMHEQAR
jgi:hypothetical protein